jgi:thiosulfate/3-mercaptopyruvate sulfurtransferase
MYSTLVSPQQLQGLTAVVVDCRSHLTQPELGRKGYEVGHLPGAYFANLDMDLAGPKSRTTGRHPLPSAEALAAKLGSWGIDNSTQVVAYDADTGAYAARLWWLLRWLGHRAVAVLDGGFAAWVAAGLPVSADVPMPRATTFVGTPNPDMVCDADDVARRVGQPDWRILDARASERFRGDVEPIDSVAGHIPGARNHPFAGNLSGGRFLPPDRLAESFRQSLAGVAADHCIAMCGSGVTACHNLLAMEIAGLGGAKLYAGSWSEWIRDPARPVAGSR